MRVGIDAREIVGRPTGVGRYLAGLLGVWVHEPRHEFVLYAPTEPAIVTGTRFTSRVVRGAGGTWWEQVVLPPVATADHLDVFFSPAYSAPLRLRVPLVVAMHDLSFFAHPEWFRTREGLRRRVLARRAADRASAIVTISEFSKREILERLHIAESKIRVIPPGIDGGGGGGTIRLKADPTGATPTGATRDRTGSLVGSGFSRIDHARVLYVGSIFNRRHIPDLIAGVAALARRRHGVSLDIVGDNRSYPREDIAAAIKAENASAFIRWHHYVDDATLGALYGSARASAFLSEYEGLGLTPLEGLADGVPPLLLDTPVARESCGDAALYVGDTRPETVAAALERLLFDEDTRAALLANATGVLARYERERAAHDTLAVFEEVAR